MLDESLVTGQGNGIGLVAGRSERRGITSASGKENMSQTCKALAGKKRDLSSCGKTRIYMKGYIQSFE